MEFNTITLDMIFAMGIKEFSCINIKENKIEQIKIEDNKLYFWDTVSEEWDKFYISELIRKHLEKKYQSFFTWEIVNNEV
jgi:hypothetical protein